MELQGLVESGHSFTRRALKNGVARPSCVRAPVLFSKHESLLGFIS